MNYASKKIGLFALLIMMFIGFGISYTIGYNSGITKIQDNINMAELGDFSNLEALEEFLAENKIDENVWVTDEYTCYTFSTDLVDAAREAGYRAQVVVKSDYMKTGTSHAFVQFWVDSINAWVLVEPQDDGILNIYTSYTKYGSWIG